MLEKIGSIITEFLNYERYKVFMQKKELEYIGNIGSLECYKFKPTVFKQYSTVYEKEQGPDYVNSVRHKVRMFLEWIRGGYTIYYFFENDICCGHAVVARGGGRVEASTKEDIVIGPIWVNPCCRKKGIGTKIVFYIASMADIKYKKAYEYILESNIPSIRVAEKNGFSFVGRAKEKGLLKKIVLDEKGKIKLFEFVTK